MIDALEPLRSRLASLNRSPQPADVAIAMRAEGMIVTDEALIETVESLRRHSVGAGPLEPLLRQPGVTDVLAVRPPASRTLTSLPRSVTSSPCRSRRSWS